MFQRIKKAFSKPAPAPRSSGPSSRLPDSPVSEWAATQGLVFSAGLGTVALEGRVRGKRWRLERGAPTRDYIRGEELRARGQLGLHEDLCALVMNRPLKESLEKKAYERYTNDLQTAVDGHLPQEVRWLAMFEEFGWDGLPPAFWDRYCVLSDRRETATGWITPALAGVMLDWPAPAPGPEVPFMLLLTRGKAYLRMEYTPAQLPMLQHAALVFTSACEAALSGTATAMPQ